MCRVDDVNAHSPSGASIMGRVDRTVTVVSVAILILLIASGCGPTIRNSVVTINNESGTVNVGNKDVSVPIRAQVPMTQ